MDLNFLLLFLQIFKGNFSAIKIYFLSFIILSLLVWLWCTLEMAIVGVFSVRMYRKNLKFLRILLLS